MTVWRQTCLPVLAAAALAGGPTAAHSASQEAVRPQVQIDQQTGRAVGAKEMAPDALKALIEKRAPVIVIDVRDEAQFAQETIKGAVHIPFTDLEAKLKDIPKETTLAFT